MKYLILLVFILTNFANAQSIKCLVVTKSIDGQYFALYSDSTWKVTNEGIYITHNNATNRTENTVINKNINSTKPTTTPNKTYNSTKQSNINTTTSSTSSSICGARTKKGGSCQRRVVGGGYCYQHR